MDARRCCLGWWNINVSEISTSAQRHRKVQFLKSSPFLSKFEPGHIPHLFDLLRRSDSVAWNPHKLLAVPQQCSTFLIRDQDMLLQANSASAVYLFQQDKFYDPKWDVGDKYLQCGRRADVLKLWLMWQAKVINQKQLNIR